MAKPKSEFHYTYETLSEMSGWPINRIHQDQSRGDLDPHNIASVAIWLAANGTDVIRAAMAAELLPAHLGTHDRGQKVNNQLELMCKSEILRVVYAADNKRRRAIAKRKSKGKLS